MRKLLVALASAAAALVAFATPSAASAADYVVHVHGRTQTTWTNTWYSMSGWTNVKCDYEAKYNTLAQSNVTVRSCLSSYCTGSNRCILVGYSNGNHQIQYTQTHYPGSLTNLLYVEAGGSAVGGSELADAAQPIQNFLDWFGGSFEVFYGNGVDATLTVSGARNAYNHDVHNGKTTYHTVGNTDAFDGLWWLTAGILPGDDDGVVAFHSAFGCRNSGSQGSGCSKWNGHVADTYCNSNNGIWNSKDHFSMDERASWCY
jgi:pimeloyl-ACP methyl ester carboxylesterase